MDAELSRFAAANKCVYSRYADDMTFSTNRQFMPLASLGIDAEGQPRAQLVKALRDIIESNGFVINDKKTRLTSRARRQIVTGLVVNKRVNVRRSSIREVRAMLFAWEKFGLGAATKHFNEKYYGKGRDFESVVRGKIGFIGQIRGRPDDIFKKLALQFNKLSVGGKIRTELSSKEISDQAVWVFESDSDLQGSAFFLEKFGIITCAHCVGDNPFIYHPANHTKRFPLKLVSIDKDRDLARFEIPDDLQNVVPLPLYGGNGLGNGIGIFLVGYPNHFAATPIRIEPGNLIRVVVKSAVSYLEISSKIIGGNSGGPVLNDKYQVIGVAVLGINGSIDLKSAEFLAVNGSEISKAFSI